MTGNGKADWQMVDLNSVKNKKAREGGAEWLCKKAFGQLNISDFLRSAQWGEEKVNNHTRRTWL